MRFIIFLTVFLSLYSGLHLYGFLSVKRALAPGPKVNVALILFMALMIFAPIIIRFLERNDLVSPARFFAYIGYIWMGLLFLFFSFAVALDVYRLILEATQKAFNADFSRFSLSKAQCFFIPLFLSVGITTFGFFEALNIRTERVIIRTDTITRKIGRLKIVQISDVHLGLIVGEHRLRRIIKQIRAEKPDILVSTGDLVDGQMNNLSGLVGMIRDIPTKYGKYAVTGNHEFHAGLQDALKVTRNAGFRVLRGEALNIPGVINIAGVDDSAGKRYGLKPNVSEKVLLSKLPRKYFTLLLKHRPQLNETEGGLFDLQLSGHTHKGQIFPFSLIVKLFYPNFSGLVSLDNNSYLYVSRGTGTWGPPVRFLCPPEVTVIELVHESKANHQTRPLKNS
ncbi:MAG TPA: metallophosphoesterase [Desulfobacterales bacterium]|nr:metallophosphoesterase [Desulfobacterales bacterium]